MLKQLHLSAGRSCPQRMRTGLMAGPMKTSSSASIPTWGSCSPSCIRRHAQRAFTATAITATFLPSAGTSRRRQHQQLQQHQLFPYGALYGIPSTSAGASASRGNIAGGPMSLRLNYNSENNRSRDGKLRTLLKWQQWRCKVGLAAKPHGPHVMSGNVLPRRCVVMACMPSAAAAASGSLRRGGTGSRRSSKYDSAAASGSATGGGGGGGGKGVSGTFITASAATSAASSPVPPPNPSSAGSSAGATASGGKGVVSTAATRGSASAGASAAVTVATKSMDGSDSDYEVALGVSMGSNIVPFARRQPRALVLDCAYRPINVLTWYKAFHFDYFGKGEVLEYYPPPAICTTGSGDHPLPAVLRVPQYTANMQDLCSRVACTRRNIMVRDGFCCQYCGSRRDLTLDHVHPVSKGGKETWENLVTACMRCNQKKSDRTLRELGWKLRRQPKEPTPFEIGIVAGVATSDILRPPPEWEAYIAPYRERLETYRRAAVEAGLVNLIDDDR